MSQLANSVMLKPAHFYFPSCKFWQWFPIESLNFLKNIFISQMFCGLFLSEYCQETLSSFATIFTLAIPS